MFLVPNNGKNNFGTNRNIKFFDFGFGNFTEELSKFCDIDRIPEIQKWKKIALEPMQK